MGFGVIEVFARDSNPLAVYKITHSRHPVKGQAPFVSLQTEEVRAPWVPDRGGSPRRFHRPNRFTLSYQSFEGKLRLEAFPGLVLFALSVGLMKPRRGSTPVVDTFIPSILGVCLNDEAEGLSPLLFDETDTQVY